MECKYYEFEGTNPNVDRHSYGFVSHGGGGTAFQKNHPVVKFLLNKVHKVYSIELPLHGSSRAESPEAPLPTPSDTIYATIQLVKNITKLDAEGAPPKVLFVGYSAGGFLLLRVWAQLFQQFHADSTAVFIGTGLTINGGRAAIDFYWQRETFVSLQKEKPMLQMHGPFWYKAVELIYNWLRPDSSLLLSIEERNKLLRHPQTYFINGVSEEAFPPLEDIVKHMDKESAALRFYAVPGGHFTYFSTSWPHVEAILTMLVDFPHQKSKL